MALAHIEKSAWRRGNIDAAEKWQQKHGGAPQRHSPPARRRRRRRAGRRRQEGWRAGYQSRNSAKRDSANAFVTLMAYQPSEEKSNLFIGTAKMAAAKAMTNLGGPRRLQYHESGSAAAGYAKRYGVTRKATRRPLERKKHLA
jgi:hypothetical protein